MVDETKFRPLLDQAHEAVDTIREFLSEVAKAQASQTAEIRELNGSLNQSLATVEEGIDHLWDLFKRRP